MGTLNDFRASLIIGLCCLLIYNANGRAISAGDAFPGRYLPFAIWGHGTLALDPVARLVTQGRPLRQSGQGPQGDVAFWVVPASTGYLVSLYPIVLPVLVAPLYLPAVAYLQVRGWTEERLDRVARLMEKLTASLLAALSSALLYLLLRRRAELPVARILTIAYAFGTTTWMIGSQALWQHGMAQLLLVGFLLCVTAPATARRTIVAGLLCGLVAGNRPPDAILAGVLGLHGLFWAERRWLTFAAAAAAPLVLVVLYNVLYTGAVAGAYGVVGTLGFFRHDIRDGLAGLLFSPTRGLFVFSPFLLFLALAWRYRPAVAGDRRLALAIVAGVLIQVLLYAAIDWRGGIAFGPRFLTDLVPLLIWLLVPVVAALGGIGRTVFATAVGVAIAIEAIGAFTYTGFSDRPIYAVDRGPERLNAAWDWQHAPFVAPISIAFAPPELLRTRLGAIERVDVDGRAVDAVVEGQTVTVSGWSTVGTKTPLQVGVSIDGRLPVTTRAFTDREDVRSVLPGAEASGWQVPIDTTGLPPGEHRLTLYVWVFEAGEPHLLTHRALTVQPRPEATLAESATIAAGRIREHQQEPGFWLTAFTKGTRFEKPQPEMNTYLTSLLVDLLDPLPAAAGLGGSVQRAREHLTAQIEDGGLVRYHGLPTAPGIGTLGCRITPDTDDTALVWRIAPDRDRRRLVPALATLEAYRRDDGLYRTWLAPRERFECLDPGRDPNPADVAIQIHLLQFLATENPDAGRALCTALRRDIGRDDIWVYYAKSSLVAILRLPDLARAGCPIELPPSRLGTSVDGQDVWVSVVRQLAKVATPESPLLDAAGVDALLRRLARDDFALLRANPPLLYHNDLTATVPRYYWSEDVGYALWLRLAHEHSSAGAP